MVFLKPIHSVILALSFSQLNAAFVNSYNDVDLPESQLPYYFNNFPQAVEKCLNDERCKHRSWLQSGKYDKNKCWGYEPGCSIENAFSTPQCAEKLPSWIKTKEEYVNAFYEHGDFGGYLRIFYGVLRFLKFCLVCCNFLLKIESFQWKFYYYLEKAFPLNLSGIWYWRDSNDIRPNYQVIFAIRSTIWEFSVHHSSQTTQCWNVRGIYVFAEAEISWSISPMSQTSKSHSDIKWMYWSMDKSVSFFVEVSMTYFEGKKNRFHRILFQLTSRWLL